MENNGTKRDLENHRYRLIDGDGKAYASFRLKPGISLAAVLAKEIPEQEDYQVERVS